ncbi:MAG: hypothetical protein M1820_003614 [Bogoriella megaspora]|nr:MAG: hypothetical protein M1820_003614 [Bogoriella megaspora]
MEPLQTKAVMSSEQVVPLGAQTTGPTKYGMEIAEPAYSDEPRKTILEVEVEGMLAESEALEAFNTSAYLTPTGDC